MASLVTVGRGIGRCPRAVLVHGGIGFYQGLPRRDGFQTAFQIGARCIAAAEKIRYSSVKMQPLLTGGIVCSHLGLLSGNARCP